jgi:DNA-directed RNA polymerase specialized sigma24 family protein
MAEGNEDMVTSREDFVKQALVDFESPLIGYATTFLHDAERARDVVQDTFIRLYQQDIDKVSGGLKAWLFTVCRNRALDVIRKEKRIGELPWSGLIFRSAFPRCTRLWPAYPRTSVRSFF